MAVSEGPWIVAVVLAQGVPGGDLAGIPWPVLLGPYGLTAYLLWDNFQLRRERNGLRQESTDLLAKYRERDEEERKGRLETERRREEGAR